MGNREWFCIMPKFQIPSNIFLEKKELEVGSFGQFNVERFFKIKDLLLMGENYIYKYIKIMTFIMFSNNHQKFVCVCLVAAKSSFEPPAIKA